MGKVKDTAVTLVSLFRTFLIAKGVERLRQLYYSTHPTYLVNSAAAVHCFSTVPLLFELGYLSSPLILPRGRTLAYGKGKI